MVRQKWRVLKATLDERGVRVWAGAEADAIGYGGVAAVARATGMGISTVRKG
ncbi:MAG TPA: ISAzo13 family transposase, partial [Polyangiaceae bacterium]